jgi:hypothetical protein
VNITILTAHTCPLCGHRSRGVMFRQVRVNRRSLRTVGVGIGAMPPSCPECAGPLSYTAEFVALDPASAAAVNAHRAARFPIDRRETS